MALCGCTPNMLVVTAALALLVLPSQYYVPERAEPPVPRAPRAALDAALARCPPLDLLATGLLALLATAAYLADWIQRKLMEKRIFKLNQYLAGSVERLRAWDAQQDQLETTLRLVQNATSEYNLLLYLLLRHHRAIPADGPPSTCFFDKGLDEGLSFLSPTVET